MSFHFHRVLKRVFVLLPLFILGATMLAGCATRQEPVIKIRTVNKYVHPPEYLLRDNIELPKPVDKKTYIEATPSEREFYNTKLILNLYKTIGKYKLKLKALREFDKNISK